MTYNQKIPPFKWFILENFPYIEEDFDALTNWQLFCKLGKEMNKIIEKCNLTGEQVERLTTAFNELKAYIDDYFENLDVQEEVNAKLDEMAEQGVLTDIIAQYLQLAGVLAYDNKQAMKQAQNLADGSITKTLGNATYKDGRGAFFKVRQIQNTDIVDDENIIALHDPDLIAEKISYSSGYDIQTNLQNQIDDMKRTKILIVGDSYAVGTTNTDQVVDSFAKILCKKYFRLSSDNYTIIAEGGAGFVSTTSSGKTFLNLLQDNLPADKETYTHVIVAGGYNDRISNYNDILSARNTFMSYVMTNFPNAKHYIGMIGNNSMLTNEGTSIRDKISNDVYNAYYDLNTNSDFMFMYGVEDSLKNYYSYISADGFHPTINGYEHIANNMYQFIKTGKIDIIEPKMTTTFYPYDGYSISATNNHIFVKNNNAYINFGIITLSRNSGSFNFNNGMFITSSTIPIYRKQTGTNMFNCQIRITANGNSTISTGYIEITNDNSFKLWSWSGDVNNVTMIDLIVEPKVLPLVYC